MPLAQYRWLVGHQLVFCAWQWLAEALQTLADSRAPDDSAISTAAALYDGYSVLLLYCGSCSPAVYGEAIRPQMMRADPAFSGRWARDYEYVVPLLPTVRRVLPPDLLEPLTAAVKSNRVVHMAVADRLVPDGESLLRESGQDTNAPPTRAQRDIFDGFFRVTRMPLCRNEFRAQLCTRIGQVRSDLTRNPLPVPCGWENTRDTYTAAVDRFHRDGVAILNRLERLIDEPT
ncbi:L-tyrosine 3-hydroxylase [Nocardia sp. BMG51109]|uniref:L-tyrosine 3-hydroxylase n=1 Tax=Nocardia sp. BMG51109 TaxID=1056816 RepID=UPI0012EB5810|nr:L-tyrosine 3-hydroxylase [Nocardia sp. BMG51109]